MMKSIKTILTIFLALSLPAAPFRLGAENETDTAEKIKESDGEKIKTFSFETGFKGQYSSGIAPSNFQSQPFAEFRYTRKYFRIKTNASGILDYQIPDGLGKFKKIKLVQPRASLSLYPHEIIELSGDYLYSSSRDLDFKNHDFTGGLFLNFEKFSVGGTFNMRNTVYDFSPNLHETISEIVLKDYFNLGQPWFPFWIKTKHSSDYNFGGELNIYITEKLGIDLGYERRLNRFWHGYGRIKTLPAIFRYAQDTGRLGMNFEPVRQLTISLGMTAGRDSVDYDIIGGDIGFTLKLFERVKISAGYNVTDYMAPSMQMFDRIFDLLNKLYQIRNFSTVIKKSGNPNLLNSEENNSYLHHNLNLSASLIL
jgi:hypothetical protein